MGHQYSVILPIYNEESCLPQVLQRVETVLTGLGRPHEIICVDDCSVDATWSIIQQFCQRNSAFKGLRFKRNFGHQAAVYAGIQYSSGNYVAVLDADGQDPPELLSDLFHQCESGFDVVNAVRRKRKENIFKRIFYALFYRFYKLVVPFEVPLDSGDFSVFSRNVADFIACCREKHPFIRGLRSWHGGRQCVFEYERQKRISGTPKYTLWKLFLLALNASITFSRIPLRFISVLGIIISLLAFGGGVFIIMAKFTVGINLIGWTSTAVLIMFFGGLNLFVLGIIGEYIGDIFDEVKNRPIFLVDESSGF